jgi:peroxiredoxin
MDAYRDQYAQVFGDTAKVALLAISVDPDTMQAAWAREKGYKPWTFLSDTGALVGKAYGSAIVRPNGSLLDNRTLFIIDPKGKIAHVMAPFREVDPTAYTELGDMIKKVSAGN